MFLQYLSKSLSSELTILKIGTSKDAHKQSQMSNSDKLIGVATNDLPKQKDAAAVLAPSAPAVMPRLQIRKSIHDQDLLRATKNKPWESLTMPQLKPITTTASTSGTESTSKAALYRDILYTLGSKVEAPSADTSKPNYAAQLSKELANAVSGTFAVNTTGIIPAEQIIPCGDQTFVRITTNSKPDLVVLNKILPNVQVDKTATTVNPPNASSNFVVKSNRSNSAFQAKPKQVLPQAGVNYIKVVEKEPPKLVRSRTSA